MINYLSLERILQYSFCLSCIIINNNDFKDKGIIFLSSGNHYFVIKLPISNNEHIIFNNWQRLYSRVVIFINAQDTQQYLLKQYNIFIKNPICLETLFLINNGKDITQLKYKYKKIKSIYQALIISKKMFISLKNNIAYSNFYTLIKVNHMESYLSRSLVNININGFFINYNKLIIKLKKNKTKLIQLIIYIIFYFKIKKSFFLNKKIFYFIERLDFSFIIKKNTLFIKKNYILRIVNIYISLFDTLKMFIKQILININYKNNRIYSFFFSKISKTGRISSYFPNLQNITKNKYIRKCFTIERPNNKKLIIADYSSYEIRIIAALSNDKNLIKMLKNKDFYSKLAFDIFTKKVNRIYNKHLRNKTKIILLGILYGMQHNTLAVLINTSISNSHKLIHKYLKKYIYFFKYMQDLIKLIKKGNHFQNVFGRKLIISFDNNINKIFNTARNMPIQSIAADIMKIAILKIYLILSSKYNNTFIINTIHDELVIECFSNNKYNIVSIVEYEMKHAFYIVLSKSNSKIKVNITNNWK